MYADDVVLIAKNEDIVIVVSYFVVVCRRRNLGENSAKRKVMVVENQGESD